MIGHSEKYLELQVFSDPLFSELAFLVEQILKSLGDLRLDGRAHERDVHGGLSLVIQLGGFTLAGELDGAAKVDRGALHISGERKLGSIALECADVDDALDLQRLGNHGAHSLRQKSLRENLEQGHGVVGEFVDLARLRGKVLCNVLPVFAGGVRLVHLVGGLVDGNGVFAMSSHVSQTTVVVVAETSATHLDLEPLDGVCLKDLTTLRIGGAPRAVWRARTAEELAQAVSLLDAAGDPLLIVGGGSNLVVADGDLDVTVVVAGNDDIQVSADGLVRAGAGAVWDDVVAAAVEAGLSGIETLSGIPGSAGATPVQNVGAYGAEVGDVLTRVHLYNRKTGETEWVPASDLDLAYRYSNLKFTGRAVVLDIELQLTPAELSISLRHLGGKQLPLAQAREEILRVRALKGMVLNPDDHDTWSAGSFFTNPVVAPELAGEIARTVETSRPGEGDSMPRYPQPDGKVKLSAAWLIERAGFHKGFPDDKAPARLSTKHTLALTNRGGAGAGDVVKLARTVRDGVRDRFGVELVPEPVWIGLSLD